MRGVESVSVNLATGGLSVRIAGRGGPDRALAIELERAVEAAGPYRLQPGPVEPESRREGPDGPDGKAGETAGFGSVAVVLGLAALTMATAMSGVGGGSAGRVVQFLLSTAVFGFFLAAGFSSRSGGRSAAGRSEWTAWSASAPERPGRHRWSN